MAGKLIVLEGTDSSGKTTQHEKLVERMRSEGRDVVVIGFPKHGHEFGKVVDEYLMGKFGKKEDLSPEFIAMLYMTDFYNSKIEMEQALESGKDIVLSRFFSSTLTYQVALAKENEKIEIWEWIRKVCERLPQPDLTLVLTVDPDISKKLLDNEDNADAYKAGKKKDQHEDDLEFQKAVFDEYKRNIDKLGWRQIDCIKEDKLMSIEDIHDLIWNEIKAMI